MKIKNIVFNIDKFSSYKKEQSEKKYKNTISKRVI
jgi:hypothetical protein